MACSTDLRISDVADVQLNVILFIFFPGELVGHKDLVSGFSFCQHAGQSHICVSSSGDGSVRFWDTDNKVLIREHAAHQVSVDSSRFVCVVATEAVRFHDTLEPPGLQRWH